MEARRQSSVLSGSEFSRIKLSQPPGSRRRDSASAMRHAQPVNVEELCKKKLRCANQDGYHKCQQRELNGVPLSRGSSISSPSLRVRGRCLLRQLTREPDHGQPNTLVAAVARRTVGWTAKYISAELTERRCRQLSPAWTAVAENVGLSAAMEGKEELRALSSG